MSFLRIPLIRGVVTVALIGLFCLSVLRIKNIVTATWQKEDREEALYLKSSHCFPNEDPTLVDQSLPPCENFAAAVAAKPQEMVVYHYRSGDHVETHRHLTLHFDNGQVRTVGDIYEDMWNSIHIGDHVAATFWRGKIREVSANGYRSSVTQPGKYDKSTTSLAVWMTVGFVCSFCLNLMWRFGRTW